MSKEALVHPGTVSELPERKDQMTVMVQDAVGLVLSSNRRNCFEEDSASDQIEIDFVSENTRNGLAVMKIQNSSIEIHAPFPPQGNLHMGLTTRRPPPLCIPSSLSTIAGLSFLFSLFLLLSSCLILSFCFGGHYLYFLCISFW